MKSRVSCLVLMLVGLMCQPCSAINDKLTVTQFTSDNNVQWMAYTWKNVSQGMGQPPKEVITIAMSMADANAQNVNYIFHAT